MTLIELMAEARRLGVVLAPEAERIRYRTAGGPLPETIRRGLVEHKERILPALRLRELHRAMGLSEDDVLFVEEALLSGRVAEVRIAPARTVEVA